jgi:Purple acid Phosphatase, N-terminal domain/Calcineurin-like phosphoesterase
MGCAQRQSTRREFLHRLGVVGVTIATGARAPAIWRRPRHAGAPLPAQLHLQFGTDAAREMVASWTTPEAVSHPRLRLGTPAGGMGTTVPAETRTHIDALSGTEVFTHHAMMRRLEPGTAYVYEVLHDGAAAIAGDFVTAPAGRASFRFTSFGDQSTPVAGDGIASPWAGYVVDQIERLQPLFHLLNGDLCYANISADRVAAWTHFFENDSRSARHRPWMPAAGNHENERGNGPIGYGAHQTRFSLPDSGADPEFRGLWYAFTAGSVRVVSLANDDVCYQDGGDTYVRGYSGGAQRAWLERTLAAARADPGIDWVVVCMHQTAISSARDANGCDRGIREAFVPLFDRYGVDVVVCGHEHHYERSHPLRGADRRSETLQPRAVGTRTDVIDTSAGTVHLVLGAGGTALPSNARLWVPARARVIVGVGDRGSNGRLLPRYVEEDATAWSAARDLAHSYGFAAFDVDPGNAPGGVTRLEVTYYNTAPSHTEPATPLERFTLVRRRSDAGNARVASGLHVAACSAATTGSAASAG